MEKVLQEARKGKKKAQAHILESFRPLVLASIKKYYYGSRDFEDLVQEGYLTILEAIRDYDPARQVYFRGFLKSRLAYCYLNMNKEPEPVSLNQEAFPGLEFIDLLVSDEDLLERIVDLEGDQELYRAYEGLSKREKQVVSQFYFLDRNMYEISQDLGIAYRTVVNTKVNALRRMRESYRRK